ncbi:MAG TPA: hypothetical protein PL066_02185 [bacterium]|nr:hypothetical protein [bacterium]
MENIKPEKSEQEKIQILRENLKVLDVLDKYSILGHGTGKKVVQNIMENGLEARQVGLNLTTIPLFDSHISYEEQDEQCFKSILNWPHNDYKIIVVVAIPNPKENETGGLGYFNKVFKELSADKSVKVGIQGADRSYVIPPEFIKGYIDVDTLQFVANPKYDPDKKVTVKDCSGGDFLEDAHKGQEENCPVPYPSPTDANNVGKNNEEVW